MRDGNLRTRQGLMKVRFSPGPDNVTVQPRTSQIPSLALRELISKIRTSTGSQLFYDVLGFGEKPNDRMISVCFQGKPFSITVIKV